MIKSFKNIGTEDVFDGVASKAARKCCPKSIWPVARRKLDQINRVQEVIELQIPPGNRLELLKGNRENLIQYPNKPTIPCLFYLGGGPSI